MSLHYEWTLSLWFRREVPEAELDELRWHLGLEVPAPTVPTLDYGGEVLASEGGFRR